MAANLSQKASNTSLIASVVATFANAPQAGNLLVAAVTANVGSLAISGWTNAVSLAVGIAGELDIFYKVSVGNETTVTASGTLATLMDLHIFEYDGIDNVSPLDKTASTADGGAGVTARASGTTATLTQANELAFVAVATAATNGGLVSWSNSYTTEITTTDLMTADLITTVTTATTSTATWNTSQRAAGAIVTFFGETGRTYAGASEIKPRLPAINWNNPITKGLIFNAPFTERGGTNVKVLGLDSAGRNWAIGGTVSWVIDLIGSALSFNGSTNSVNNTLNNPPAGASARSISLHFKANSTAQQVLFSTGITNTNNHLFEFLINGATTLQFAGWNNDNNFTVGTISTGVWYHAALTFDGVNLNVYLNATPSTAVNKSTLVTTGASLTIGRRINLVDLPFNGLISDVNFWNRALNLSEIKQLYSNPWQIYTQPGLLMV